MMTNNDENNSGGRQWVRLQRILAGVALMLAGTASAAEVMVYAAASLTHAFQDIATAYHAVKPEATVVFSFAASDVLQRQIVNGAPADIFASADQIAMDKAGQAGVIQVASRTDFASNTLVLIVPGAQAGTTAQGTIRTLADLTQEAVTRVALGNPETVPAGRYARAGLREHGLWPVVERKQILGQNVRQVLDYVARGEVDAGAVFATDAALMHDKVRVVDTIDSPVPVRYPIALVQREGLSADARDLYAFILSRPGQHILREHGFGAP